MCLPPRTNLVFMLGLSTTKAIHLVRRLLEQYRDKKRLTHGVLELEQAYDKVLMEVLRRCSESTGVHVAYIWATKDMHDGAKIRVKAVQATYNTFESRWGYTRHP